MNTAQVNKDYLEDIEAKAEAYGYAQARIKALEEIIDNLKYSIEIIKTIATIKKRESDY